MATQSKDPALLNHLAWLGYVQPEGLVVSAPALVDAQVVIDRATLAELQTKLDDHVSDVALREGDGGAVEPGVLEIPRFLSEFLEWPVDQLVGWDAARPVPEELRVALPEFGETLSPTYALTAATPPVGASPWMLLVQCHPAATDLDKPAAAGERGWLASPAKKFERLLRETQVAIGLITNGVSFRLVYAPPKENSGSLTFRVGAMTEVSGRLILGAFHLLLNEWTLFSAPSAQRLPSLLQRSRDYQASVSEKLAEQVLHALYELLRGLEAADGQAKGNLLRELAAVRPHDIYGGLVTVLLRLVFVLFAEDRGLLPMSGLYVRHYSVRGLFERLRADAEKYPDTMDLRYGSWAQLLALFRLIHGGCEHPELKMPAREGHLFDPNRHSFLEGRAGREDLILALPLVSDGVLYRILEKLCVLEGERVSYRTLDVEEIGSVYQTIMGFDVQIAAGTAIGLKGKRKNGGVPASPVIYLEALLEVPSKDRPKWLKEMADTELTGAADAKLKASDSVDDLLDALGRRIESNATPSPVPKGGLVLQPTDERRRSGSHYTPRSFTEPIVRKTLEPVLKRFGEKPSPDQILSLKICDIAVGSAAFLVETCRQLADVLVRAWRVHGGRPALPPDETEELLSMRTIAQRCVYGVDRNPMAVDLAKLSLWLATLAKDHPFTFLDHAIRCGDSLVGLTRRQIETFTWKTGLAIGQLWEPEVRKRTGAALRERQDLLILGDDYGTTHLKRERLEKADHLLDLVRFIGDAAVAAFFAADKDKAREVKRAVLAERIADYLGTGDLMLCPTDEVKTMRGGKFSVTPFHWEIEYPEVFDRENPGFDGIVGNPPFLGGARISTTGGMRYFDYLTNLYEPAGHQCDLVGYFFRRAFSLLRKEAALGLIATNTIAQGDTRSGGLFPILAEGGCIYAATRRQKWPGIAAVIVSPVHISKHHSIVPAFLDGHPVERISAYLFPGKVDASPKSLLSSPYFSKGSQIYGQGFLFDDTDEAANPISLMLDVLANESLAKARILPFVGGEELNEQPIIKPYRYAIYLSDIQTEEELAAFPRLSAIVRQKVKPERDELGSNPNNTPLKKRWWAYQAHRPELYKRLANRRLVLAHPEVGPYLGFQLLPTGWIYNKTMILFELEAFSAFAVVQSRMHEVWARTFGSSLKDDLRYTSSDCFETFPFPAGFEKNAAMETAGRAYYEFRAVLMQDLWLGLTEIYNLFHSPDDEMQTRLEALYRKRAASEWRTAEAVPADRSPLTLFATPLVALAAVQRLRALHTAMDIAVLTAYGWTDLLPKCVCEFLLDYEDDTSESSAEESGSHKRKKPWRYRWPDETRDALLARLLKLNAERAEEERLAGVATVIAEKHAPLTGNKPSRKKKSSGVSPTQPELLPPPQGDLFA